MTSTQSNEVVDSNEVAFDLLTIDCVTPTSVCVADLTTAVNCVILLEVTSEYIISWDVPELRTPSDTALIEFLCVVYIYWYTMQSWCLSTACRCSCVQKNRFWSKYIWRAEEQIKAGHGQDGWADAKLLEMRVAKMESIDRGPRRNIVNGIISGMNVWNVFF